MEIKNTKIFASLRASTNTLDFPHRIEQVAEFFLKGCPTKIMGNMYHEYLLSETLEDQTQIIRKMFQEYMNLYLIFKQFRTKRRCTKHTPNPKRYSYKHSMYQWLLKKFPNFHEVSFDWEAGLLCGKPQAGKSAFTFGIVSIELLSIDRDWETF